MRKLVMKRKYLLTVLRQESMLTVSVFSNTSTERGLSENKCPLYCIIHYTLQEFSLMLSFVFYSWIYKLKNIHIRASIIKHNSADGTELIIHLEKNHDVRCAPTPPVLQHIHKNEENHRKKSCVVNFNFYSSNILCRQLHDIWRNSINTKIIKRIIAIPINNVALPHPLWDLYPGGLGKASWFISGIFLCLWK